MSKTLNLDTFNEILFGALKENTKKEELLQMEVEMAYGLKIQKMEELVECLNQGKPYHEILQQVNNIDGSCDYLMKQLEEVKGENEE